MAERIGPAGAMPFGCPARLIADQLADKWSICVLLALADGAVRFNELKRQIVGVTQKMLGQTLRRLECNGLVDRTAYATMPMRVDYALTPLGQSLLPTIVALRTWAEENEAKIEEARARSIDPTRRSAQPGNP